MTDDSCAPSAISAFMKIHETHREEIESYPRYTFRFGSDERHQVRFVGLLDRRSKTDHAFYSWTFTIQIPLRSPLGNVFPLHSSFTVADSSGVLAVTIRHLT